MQLQTSLTNARRLPAAALALAALVALGVTPTRAHDYTAGPIKVSNPWTRVTVVTAMWA